jgi:hypothetical protein
MKLRLIDERLATDEVDYYHRSEEGVWVRMPDDVAAAVDRLMVKDAIVHLGLGKSPLAPMLALFALPALVTGLCDLADILAWTRRDAGVDALRAFAAGMGASPAPKR